MRLYARSDVKEVVTPFGRHSLSKKQTAAGERLVVDAGSPDEVEALLDTGMFAKDERQIPQTPDEAEDLRRNSEAGQAAIAEAFSGIGKEILAGRR